ncbi:TetR/AcrR family transcriptional regulator [Micrococcus endophyticus]|uniref:TetR/AcrR family transcriptional regulator n=1 Tax=Micrococcus TaxID=1269 RepID=UPI0035A9A3A6
MATRPRREDVRAAILDHAAQVFGREGYARSSLTRIAAEAGYTKGAVYSGFAGKPDLFAAACTVQFERATTRAMDGVADALDDPDLPREDLVARVAEALADVVLEPTGSWPLLLHEFQSVGLREPAVGRAYRVLTVRRRDFLAGLLREHRVLADVPDAQVTHTAAMLLMLVHTLTVERHLAPEDLTVDDVRDTLAAAVRSLLP